MPRKHEGVSDENIKLFASDLRAYSRVCLRIRTKDAEVKQFTFNNAQKHLHQKLADQYAKHGRVRAIVLKARQEGVSTYTAARFFRRTTMFPNQEALILADKLDRAKKLFSIYDRFYYNLPPEMKPMTRFVSKQTQMVFDNPDDKDRYNNPGLGSSVTVETASDSDAGRASTTNLVHASEMAFWPNGEDVWVALYQAVPRQNSEIIIESTANGVGTFFHNFWTMAEEATASGDTSGFMAVFLPWWIHEEYELDLSKEQKAELKESLDDNELAMHKEGVFWEGKRHKISLNKLAWRRDQIRLMMGNERAFRQEYPSTAEEAFLVSGNGFFDEDLLKAHDRIAIPPIKRGNLIKAQGGIVFKPSEKGYMRLWMRPSEKRVDKDSGLVLLTEKEPLYLIAADTASGRAVTAQRSNFADPEDERGGRDFSCADIFDVRNRRQVAQIHGRMAPEVFAELISHAGYYYSTATRTGTRTPALIAVEANHSSGETVLNLLKNGHPLGKFGRYPRLYYSRHINRRMNKVQQRLGWVTNVETRQAMLDNLAQALREGTIEIPNRDTIKEMFTFVRGDDGKPAGQEGTHDDRVISLAIAAFIATQVHLEPPKHYQDTELEMVGSSATGLFNY